MYEWLIDDGYIRASQISGQGKAERYKEERKQI
jgi:hypothetical protein